MTGLSNLALLAAETTRLGDALGGWGKISVAAAVFAVSIGLAVLLGKRLRMQDYTFKIGLVLFAMLAGVAITATGWPPHLGIDLSGGVVLIYEIDQTQKDPDNPVDMDTLLAAIMRRVNPAGVKEVVIRKYGDEQIEIIIPEVDESEVARIQKTISSIGSLEFRILANRFDHPDQIRRAEASIARNLRDGEVVVARWVPLVKSAEDGIIGNRDFAVRKSARTDLDQWEILVVIDAYNVTGDYLRRASADIGQNGRPCVRFQFDADGAKWFGRLTGDNLPNEAQNRVRHLAILLDGMIHSAPTIRGRISDRGEITGQFTKEEVEDLVAVLKAGSLPTALNKEPISRMVTGPRLGQDTVNKGQVAILLSMAAVLVFMLVYYRFAGVVACGALVANIVLVLAAMITIHARFTLPGLAGLILTVGMAVDANVLIFERIREELRRGAALRMAIRNGFNRATTTIIDSNVTTLITAIVLYMFATDQVKGFAVTLFLGIVVSMFTAIVCARLIFEIAERRRWITRLSMMHVIGDTKINFVGLARPAIAASLVVIVIGMVGVTYRGKSLLDIDFTGGTSVTALLEPTDAAAGTLAPPPVTIREVRDRVNNVGKEVQAEIREVLLLTRRTEMTAEIRRDLGEGATDEQIQREFELRLDQRSTLPDVVVSSLELKLPGEAADEAVAADEDELPSAADSTDAAAESATETYFLINTSNPDVYAVEEILKRVLVFDDHQLATNHVTIGPLAMVEATPPADSGTDDEGSGASDQPDSTVEPGDASDTHIQTDESTSGTAVVDDCQDPPTDEDATDPDENGGADTETPDTETPGTATPKPLEADPASADGPKGVTFVGGSAATMKFSQKISHGVLVDQFDRALEATEREKVPIEISNPAYETGSDVGQNEWQVKIALPPEDARPVFELVAEQLAQEPYFPSSSKIGGSVAGKFRQMAMTAMLASLVAIVGYIWIRFQRLAYGLAAVVALVHDVLITLGALALSFWLADALGFLLIETFKISLPIVAAFLTIIGYSLNDTIVVFDRIREVKAKSPQLTADIINKSINQTLSRTVLTAVTTLIVVLILYAIGGAGIHGFAFCMIIGVAVGTYSSVFIAAPALLWLSKPRGAPARAQTAKSTAKTPVGSA